MKRVIKVVAIAGLSLFGFNNQAVAQVDKGNVLIDLYYGYPNVGKKTADLFNVEDSDLRIGGVGPAGIRVEYMLASNFGLGVDFIYNSTTLNFQEDSLDINSNVVATYDVKASIQRVRVMLRANYHFVQTDAMDAYVGFGAGTNNRFQSIKTDFPNYDGLSSAVTLLPVSARICLGTRFYFTENIGANVELGLGGPLISAGLSLKF
jgi:opacity protein-like surface antigen